MLKTLRPGLLLGLLIPIAIWAADVVIPFTFSPGGAIRAAEMNANFEAVRAGVNSRAVTASGSRLKIPQVRGNDGFSVPLTHQGYTVAWDSLLQISCIAYNEYCLPLHSVASFSDPACTAAVATSESGISSMAQLAAAFGQDGGAFLETSRFGHSGFFGGVGGQFYRLGPVQTGPTYYRQNQPLADGGVLTTCVAEGPQAFYPATPEPESTFARFEFTVQ